ncbi:MAG: DUF1593 domain-containing protein [Tannerella sp.]|nr:DUF1593 domain-containing protein [Tannerella sp.]
MRLEFLIIMLWLACFVAMAQDKPSVIVLTDIGGDSDDEQSMVRFLLYADMFDVKAICATSRLGHGHDTKPEILRNQIEAYRKVYPNLTQHSSGYPVPDSLLSVIKTGQGDPARFGQGYDSEASEYIIKVIDESHAPVHIVIWGGQRELAHALWKVKEMRSKEQVDLFCRKIQIHAIGDQDKHREWILTNFGNIRYIADGYVFPGNFGIRELATFRGMYMTGEVNLQDAEWVKKYIHGHGALSECYPLRGHGTDGMKEGDSPSFMGLIANGLNVPEHPEWGGWGGRFRPLGNHLYIDATDFLNGTQNERHSVARWRPAFQRDFMSRVERCVKPCSQVNHHPKAIINGSSDFSPVFIRANVGDRVSLDASESCDPDHDSITFRWFFYDEICFAGYVALQISSDTRQCSFIVPESMKNLTCHLILEISDNGIPSLVSYKRVILQIS